MPLFFIVSKFFCTPSMTTFKNVSYTNIHASLGSIFAYNPRCSSGNISAMRLIISSVITCKPALRETPDGSSGIYGLPIFTYTFRKPDSKGAENTTRPIMSDRQNRNAGTYCQHCCSSNDGHLIRSCLSPVPSGKTTSAFPLRANTQVPFQEPPRSRAPRLTGNLSQSAGRVDRRLANGKFLFL